VTSLVYVVLNAIDLFCVAVKPNKVTLLHSDSVFHPNNNTLGRSVEFNSPRSYELLLYLVVLSCNGMSNISVSFQSYINFTLIIAVEFISSIYYKHAIAPLTIQ